MDQSIANYLNSLIKERLSSPDFSGLNDQQIQESSEKLRERLYKTAVEELINRLNEHQINQIADLDFNSPQMEAKLEEFAATTPDFLSILEGRFQQELTNFQPSLTPPLTN